MLETHRKTNTEDHLSVHSRRGCPSACMCILGPAPWFRGCWSVGPAKSWEVSASQMGEAPSSPPPLTLLILKKPIGFGLPDQGMPRASEPHVSNLHPPNLPMWPIPDPIVCSLCRQHSLPSSVSPLSFPWSSLWHSHQGWGLSEQAWSAHS